MTASNFSEWLRRWSLACLTTPPYYAAHKKKVNQLLDNGVTVISLRVEAARLILSAGADLRPPSEAKLLLAIVYRLYNPIFPPASIAMLNLLCSAGADVNALDSAEYTPLHALFCGPSSIDLDVL